MLSYARGPALMDRPGPRGERSPSRARIGALVPAERSRVETRIYSDGRFISGPAIPLTEDMPMETEGPRRIADTDAETSPSRASLPTFRSSIIGREAELAELKRGLDEAAQGRGGFYLVEGAPGIGKTRLIEELRGRARERGMTELAADCSIESVNVPYQPFIEVMDQYIKEFLTYNEIERAPIRGDLAARLGKKSQILMDMNPRMRIVFGREYSMDRIEPERENRRFMAYAAEFFLHLSALEKTVLIVIDNMQWIDGGSAEIVNEMLKGIRGHPLMIVGSARTSDPGGSRDAGAFTIGSAAAPRTRIRLGPMGSAEIDSLVAGLLPGPVEGMAALSGYVRSKSGGNPYFIIEILRRLSETGIIERGGPGWTIREDALPGLEMGKSLVDVLLERLARLDGPGMEALEQAAVLGHRFSAGILDRIAAMRGDGRAARAGEILEKAERMQLIEREEGASYRFAHDKIREALLARIGAPEKRRLHRMAGLALETAAEEGDERVFMLADHFIEAEEIPEAVEYALRAGLAAKRIYANEEAIHFLSFVHSRMDARDPRRDGILEALGDLHCLAGGRAKAIDAFTALSMRARTRRDKARILYKLGRAHARLEDDAKCIRYVLESIRLMGQPFPTNRTLLVLGAVAELAAFRLNPFRARAAARSRPPGPARERATGVLSAFIPLVEVFFRNDILSLVWLCLRGLNVALRGLGRSTELAFFLGMGAGFYLIRGRYGESFRFQAASLNMLRDEESPEIAQACLRYLAALKEWTGYFDSSLELLDRAMRITESVGDRQSIIGLYQRYRNVHYWTGNYAKAKEYNEAYLALGLEQDDAQVKGDALFYRSLIDYDSGEWRALPGHIEDARNVISRYRPLLADFCISFVRGSYLLASGDAEEAITCLEEARRIFMLDSFSPIYTGHVMGRLADAYLERFAALERSDPRRKALLKEMARHDAMARRRIGMLPPYAADSLLLRARRLDAEGRSVDAERFFRKAIATAERIGLKPSLARATLEFGRFLSRNGRRNESEGSLARAYRLFGEMGVSGSQPEIPAPGMDLLYSPPRAPSDRDARALRLMARLSRIATKDEWDAAMRDMAGLISERAGAEFACVLGIDPATNDLRILGTAGPEAPLGLKEALSLPAVYTAIARREAYAERDFACVPVILHGDARGACFLSNPGSGKPIDADLELTAALVAHACRIWENLALGSSRTVGIDKSCFEASCGASRLTERERELLFLVVKGLTNKEICLRRSISMSTLRSHLNHVYAKAGTSDREALIARFSAEAGFD